MASADAELRRQPRGQALVTVALGLWCFSDSQAWRWMSGC